MVAKTSVQDGGEEVANDGKGEYFEIKEEEMFEVKGMPLFCTRVPGRSKQNPCSKKLNHTSIVEKAV